MSTSALRLVVRPLPEMFDTPEPFNPEVHHVTQEQALDATSELSDKRFVTVGSIEQYSGEHPKYGRCLIIITATSDSLIIPMT